MQKKKKMHAFIVRKIYDCKLYEVCVCIMEVFGVGRVRDMEDFFEWKFPFIASGVHIFFFIMQNGYLAMHQLLFLLHFPFDKLYYPSNRGTGEGKLFMVIFVFV